MAKVLIADDAGFIRRWCNQALTAHGHTVIEAEDGVEAVKKFNETHPEVVLLDVTMPLMDGLTTLKAIRKINPHARVAMLTSMGQMDVVLEARRAGAKDFILKPCPTDRLIQAIDRLLL